VVAHFEGVGQSTIAMTECVAWWMTAQALWDFRVIQTNQTNRKQCTLRVRMTIVLEISDARSG
jgi:hypothetical protein